jgi:hypothetical protein
LEWWFTVVEWWWNVLVTVVEWWWNGLVWWRGKKKREKVG